MQTFLMWETNDILKILYYQSGTNNFNSIMIAIVLWFPIFNYRIQRRYWH